MKIQKFNVGVLDEKGFVFLDDNGNPFFIRMWSGEPWLFYWHTDKKWVSLRLSNQTEIWLSYDKKLTDEQANIYHNFNEKDT